MPHERRPEAKTSGNTDGRELAKPTARPHVLDNTDGRGPAKPTAGKLAKPTAGKLAKPTARELRQNRRPGNPPERSSSLLYVAPLSTSRTKISRQEVRPKKHCFDRRMAANNRTRQERTASMLPVAPKKTPTATFQTTRIPPRPNALRVQTYHRRRNDRAPSHTGAADAPRPPDPSRPPLASPPPSGSPPSSARRPSSSASVSASAPRCPYRHPYSGPRSVIVFDRERPDDVSIGDSLPSESRLVLREQAISSQIRRKSLKHNVAVTESSFDCTLWCHVLLLPALSPSPGACARDPRGHPRTNEPEQRRALL